jgi:signal transduction histidine kinase
MRTSTSDGRGGLRARTFVASGLLALLVGGTFAVLLLSIDELRTSSDLDRHTQQVLAASNRLERLVVDLETGLRGFAITREERFLEPWEEARLAVPEQARTLQQLVADNGEQRVRAALIAQAATAYVEDYSPLVIESVRRSEPDLDELIDEGKRHLDAMRADFDAFITTERELSTVRHEASVAASRTAAIAAVIGILASLVLIVAFATYLGRVIVRPVRSMANAAGRIAAGDLTARAPDVGVAEIGTLGRSFNAMAASVERTQAELTASRARIVAAADDARRRIERDLHDGIQQRIVSLGLELRATELAVQPEMPDLQKQVSGVADGLETVLEELREISRGIHPAILSEGGLGPALRALGRRSPIPVDLDVRGDARLPQHVEVTAYYVASEALANAAKHADASRVEIDLRRDVGLVRLSIRDDGVGGAEPTGGSGLVGLRDRAEALGGTMVVSSPVGGGTSITVDLPVAEPSGANER